MTTGTAERRQRWAAFSVRAHRDLGSLAADILLYDRIILPVPEDEPEYERWIRANWNPADIAPRVVQAAGRIIPVPWTAQLRAEWKNRWDALRALGGEVGYGLTGVVYASYPPAWAEIVASVPSDQLPPRKPAVLAGFQSAEEARAELGLVPASGARESAGKPGDNIPGARPVDLVVALQVRRMVHEPAVKDPEEAFLTAVSLAENSRFQHARRNLFDWEDKLFVDGWEPEEAEKELLGLEEEYRDAVRATARQTRMRLAATLIPKAAGWAVAASGHPHAKGLVTKSLSFLAGHFTSMPPPMYGPIDPETHPGAALDMIRAAYRNEHPEPAEERLESDSRIVD
jgi:hypothetical protein